VSFFPSRDRREPFTAVGIRRVPCCRCGAPSVHQWQACADRGNFRPLCLGCDIALNKLVLKWMGDPNAAVKVQRYEREQRA
jgi:hypothetical protein